MSTTVTWNTIVPELQGVPAMVALVLVVDVVMERHIPGRVVALVSEYLEMLRLYGETPPLNEMVT